MTITQLKSVCSVKQAEEVLIIRAFEILEKRVMRDTDQMTDPSNLGRYLVAHLAPSEREVFCVVFMDTKHRIIAVEDIFFGTIDGCEVHPREVVRMAIKHNAAACVLAHNHPSGDTTPSAADRAVTARLKQSLALVDVRLLDHFIVAGSRYESMATKGLV